MAVRIDRNRSLPIPYRPASPPAPGSESGEILRAVWDEFARIATSLVDLDRPMSLSVHGDDTINVGAVASYLVMLDAAPITDWESPGGMWNASTGVWQCPTEGLYLVNTSVVSNPFAAPATKSYSVNARLTKTAAVGGTTVYSFAGGGLDDQFVTAVGAFLVPLAQGDTLQLSAAGVHATKTGTNAVTAFMNITRQSGIGNAN